MMHERRRLAQNWHSACISDPSEAKAQKQSHSVGASSVDVNTTLQQSTTPRVPDQSGPVFIVRPRLSRACAPDFRVRALKVSLTCASGKCTKRCPLPARTRKIALTKCVGPLALFSGTRQFPQRIIKAEIQRNARSAAEAELCCCRIMRDG